MNFDHTTALAHFGGQKFVAMTGAKDLVFSASSLSMRLGRNSLKGCTHMVVSLAHDLYTLQFLNCRCRGGYKVLTTEAGIFADQLQAVFTQKTGLLTSL